MKALPALPVGLSEVQAGGGSAGAGAYDDGG